MTRTSTERIHFQKVKQHNRKNIGTLNDTHQNHVRVGCVETQENTSKNLVFTKNQIKNLLHLLMNCDIMFLSVRSSI